MMKMILYHMTWILSN